jgi:hypothetical protein
MAQRLTEEMQLLPSRWVEPATYHGARRAVAMLQSFAHLHPVSPESGNQHCYLTALVGRVDTVLAASTVLSQQTLWHP